MDNVKKVGREKKREMANIKAHLATLILAAEAQIQMGFFHCAFSPNVQREDKWTTGKKAGWRGWRSGGQTSKG